MEFLHPVEGDFQQNSNRHLRRIMKNSFKELSERQLSKVEGRFEKMVKKAQENKIRKVELIEEILMKCYWMELT